MLFGQLSLEAFGSWLARSTTLHKDSIYRYVHAVKLIAEYLELSSGFKDLFIITDLATLDSAETEFFSESENRRKNDDGNNMYSAAFHHYRRFVEYMTNDTVNTDGLDLESDDKVGFAASSSAPPQALVAPVATPAAAPVAGPR